MNPTPHPSCPSCGQPIPPGAPEGLCPRCLMLGAAEPPPPRPSLGGAPLPTREELAEAFPALEIGDMIGHGGMGAVFLVRQPKLERDVALKVLPRALAADPSFAQRFHREARALARLNHPNIVTVFDYGEQGGWYYLLMEFVDGVNLRQAMRTQRFTPEQALEIVPQICGALQYAHGEGVLHRDIKPENLLLDSKGRVKIVDFGIAKLGQTGEGEPALTLSGARLGTMAYMAPEQIEQPAKVDHRADIYSLGVVFYEMLTGELPIGRFAAPSEKSPVGPQVDEVVFRTLEKEPGRRFQSAGEMRTQVETLTGEPATVVGEGGPPLPPPLPPPSGIAGRVGGRFTGPAMSLALLIAGALLWGAVAFMINQMHRGSEPMFSELLQERTEMARLPTILAGTLIGGLGLAGIGLGWFNLVRLRTAGPPRRGIVVASIIALLAPCVPLWMVLAINVHDEPLAWFDGIVLTGLLLLWFVCWLNPRPLPWSLPALLAFTLAVVPVLFIAHAWRGHADAVDTRWAQEMNILQIRINELQNSRPPGAAESEISRLERDLDTLHLEGRPRSRVPFSSGQRACFALSACAAFGGTLLGWTTRRQLRAEHPRVHRGRPLAEFAAWFWPVVVGPVLLLFLA
ncbi:MAG: protein kinase domain-containing protein [Verrucomicrobiales bacterium]